MPTRNKCISLKANQNLSSIRIIQKNIVYLIGLSAHIAKEEILASYELCGQYGTITKIAINKAGYAQNSTSKPTYSAYVTYQNIIEAATALLCIDNCTIDSNTIRCSFGTTKYCNFFLKGMPCVNKDCLYLHSYASESDCVNKDDVVGGNKQIFLEQQKIALDIINMYESKKYVSLNNNLFIHGSNCNSNSKYAFPSKDILFKKENAIAINDNTTVNNSYHNHIHNNSNISSKCYNECNYSNNNNTINDSNNMFNYNNYISPMKEHYYLSNNINNNNNNNFNCNCNLYEDELLSSLVISNENTTSSSSSVINSYCDMFVFLRKSKQSRFYPCDSKTSQMNVNIVPVFVYDLILKYLRNYCLDMPVNKINVVNDNEKVMSMWM